MWETSIFGFTLYQLFWYFVLYSLLGWCAEVVFCTVNTGKFVNRGFLNGPVCPIYGFGMLIVLCALTPLSGSLPVLFVGGAVLASLLELVTGFALEKLFHTQWWDYSDKPFNVGGYICLSFSLLWGLLIVLVMRVIHPVVAGAVAVVPTLAGEIAAVPVLLAYLADLAVTVRGILKFNRSLGELEKIAQALHKVSQGLSETLGEKSLEAAAAVGEKGQALGERLEETKANLSGLLDGTRASLDEKRLQAALGAAEYRDELQRRLDELQARYNELMAARPSRISRRLMRAFPDMKLRRGGEILDELRERLKRK